MFHLDKLLCSVEAVNKSPDSHRQTSSWLRINVIRCLISSGLLQLCVIKKNEKWSQPGIVGTFIHIHAQLEKGTRYELWQRQCVVSFCRALKHYNTVLESKECWWGRNRRADLSSSELCNEMLSNPHRNKRSINSFDVLNLTVFFTFWRMWTLLPPRCVQLWKALLVHSATECIMPHAVFAVVLGFCPEYVSVKRHKKREADMLIQWTLNVRTALNCSRFHSCS